jgi:hypothetical protein
MRRVGRLRYSDDAVGPQHPGERDLRRRRVVSGCDRLQLAAAQQAALLDRRIGHDRDSTLAAPRHEIPFDAAPGEIVQHLVGLYFVAARQSDELRHFGDVEIADAPAADFAGLDQRIKRFERLLQGNAAEPVQQIEIENVDAEPPQAAFARRDGVAL